VSTPVRLFLVSPARAVRRALALALDAEADIEVVGEADSSREALARVPAVRPDVVLAGSRLHDPDSPEMCRLLLAALPELHVLFIDVDADQKLVAGVMTAGASGMVPDTSDEEDLVEAIETAAAGRTVMSTKALMAILHASHKAVGKDPLAGLTALERELFELVGQGLSNAEIATEMRLAPGTVRNYVSRLLRKLGVERRAQLVVLAAQQERPAERP
jgi:two-component system response regulator DevR